MKYRNELTMAAYVSIKDFIKGKSSESMDLKSINSLDFDAICEVRNNQNTLLLDTVSLAIYNSIRCCFVIDELLRKAMKLDKKAFAFLLSHRNAKHLIPYYVALGSGIHDVFQRCSSWYFFAVSMKFISMLDLENLHFMLDKTGSSPLHILVQSGNLKLIQSCFNDLNRFIIERKSSPILMANLLLDSNKSGLRLIDSTMITSDLEGIKCVLNQGILCFKNGWFSLGMYQEFLMGNHFINEGFTILHRILEQKNDQVLSAYMFTVFEAVNNRILSLNSVRNLFITPTKSGCPPLHQAINSGSLLMAKLFLELYRTLFTKEEYVFALSLRFKGMQPRCSDKKENSAEINSLVSFERRKNHETPNHRHKTYQKRTLGSRTNSLVNLANILVRREKAEQPYYCLAPAIVFFVPHMPMLPNLKRAGEEPNCMAKFNL